MHISPDGFVAGPNGEMDWIKVDEEIFDHVGKRISEGDTALYGRVTTSARDSPSSRLHVFLSNFLFPFKTFQLLCINNLKWKC